METAFWYCPKCDRDLRNWRTCSACGGAAVYQRFSLWPIAPNARDGFYKAKEQTNKGRANKGRAKKKRIMQVLGEG